MAQVTWTILCVCGALGCLSPPPSADDQFDDDDAGLPDASVSLPAGLLAWYRMNDPPHDGVKDETGAHHGDCDPCPQRVAGRFGAGYMFDGADRRITIDMSTDFHTPSGTIAAWARTEEGAGCVMTLPYIPASGHAWLLMLYDAGPLFQANSGVITSEISLQGMWFHFAGTWDEDTTSLFVNGDFVGSGGDPNMDFDGSDEITLGAEYDNGWGAYFHGTIDDVRVYDHALSPSEIQSIAALD